MSAEVQKKKENLATDSISKTIKSEAHNCVRLDEKYFYPFNDVKAKSKKVIVLKTNVDETEAKAFLMKEIANRSYDESFVSNAKILSCEPIYIASAKMKSSHTDRVSKTDTHMVSLGYNFEDDVYESQAQYIDGGSYSYTSYSYLWKYPTVLTGYKKPSQKTKDIGTENPKTKVYVEGGISGLSSSYNSTSADYKMTKDGFSETTASSSSWVEVLILEPMYEMCIEFQGRKYYQYISAYNRVAFTSGPIQEKARKKLVRSSDSLIGARRVKSAMFWLVGLIPVIALVYLGAFVWGKDFVSTNSLIWSTRKDWIIPIIKKSSSVFLEPTLLAIVAFVWACLKIIFNVTPILIPIIYAFIVYNSGYDRLWYYENVRLTHNFMFGNVKTMRKFYNNIRSKFMIKYLIWIAVSLGVVFVEYAFLKWLIFSLYV